MIYSSPSDKKRRQKVSITIKENTMTNILYSIAGILTIVGAINWGLVGVFDYNLVSTLFGTMPGIMKVVYAAIGISGLIFGVLWLGNVR